MNKNLQQGIMLIGATILIGGILGVGSYYIYNQKETLSFDLGVQGQTIKDATVAIKEEKYSKAVKILEQYPDDLEAQTLLQYVNDQITYSQGDLSLDTYVKLVESNVQLVDNYYCVSGDNIKDNIYTLRRAIMAAIKNFSTLEVKNYISQYLNAEYYEVASILNYSIMDSKDEEYETVNNFLMGIDQPTYTDKQTWLEAIPYNYSGMGSEAISHYMIQFYGSQENWEIAYNDYLKAQEELESIRKHVEAYNASKPKDPAIGMTKNEILESSWGKPSKVNTDIYEWGTKEQWCYSKGYIYFRDEIVSSIQKR